MGLTYEMWYRCVCCSANAQIAISYDRWPAMPPYPHHLLMSGDGIGLEKKG